MKKIVKIVILVVSLLLTSCSTNFNSSNDLSGGASNIKTYNSTEISNLFKDSVFKIKIQNSKKITIAQGSGFIIRDRKSVV